MTESVEAPRPGRTHAIIEFDERPDNEKIARLAHRFGGRLVGLIDPDAPTTSILDVDVVDVLRNMDNLRPANVERVASALDKVRVQSLRELLIHGRDKIATVHGLKDATLPLLDRVVLEIDPDRTWQRKPTMRQVVELTSGLEQVPGTALTRLHVDAPWFPVASILSVKHLYEAEQRDLAAIMPIDRTTGADLSTSLELNRRLVINMQEKAGLYAFAYNAIRADMQAA